MIHKIFDLGCNGIANALNFLFQARSDSLIEYTRNTRVEPMVLLDSRVLQSDSIKDIMLANLNIFSAMYLQATIGETLIGNVQVSRRLDKLNPNRSPVDTGLSTAGMLISTEAFENVLPAVYDYAKKLPDFASVSAESLTITGYSVESLGSAIGKPTVGDSLDTYTEGAEHWSQAEKRKFSEIAVGNLLTVRITDGEKSIDVPVTIKFVNVSLPSAAMTRILGKGGRDLNFKDRWVGWRSGRLKFVEDILLMQDLYDERMKRGVQDLEGVYRAIQGRKTKNKLAGLISANPSVATASNFVIIDSSTADEIALSLGSDLSDFKTREELFQETAMMCLIIIDEAWKNVTYYYKGQTLASEYRFDQIRAGGAGAAGNEILQIMKSLNSPLATPSIL